MESLYNTSCIIERLHASASLKVSRNTIGDCLIDKDPVFGWVTSKLYDGFGKPAGLKQVQTFVSTQKIRRIWFGNHEASLRLKNRAVSYLPLPSLKRAFFHTDMDSYKISFKVLEICRFAHVGYLPIPHQRGVASHLDCDDDHHLQEDLRRPRQPVEVSDDQDMINRNFLLGFFWLEAKVSFLATLFLFKKKTGTPEPTLGSNFSTQTAFCHLRSHSCRSWSWSFNFLRTWRARGEDEGPLPEFLLPKSPSEKWPLAKTTFFTCKKSSWPKMRPPPPSARRPSLEPPTTAPSASKTTPTSSLTRPLSYRFWTSPSRNRSQKSESALTSTGKSPWVPTLKELEMLKWLLSSKFEGCSKKTRQYMLGRGTNAGGFQDTLPNYSAFVIKVSNIWVSHLLVDKRVERKFCAFLDTGPDFIHPGPRDGQSLGQRSGSALTSTGNSPRMPMLRKLDMHKCHFSWWNRLMLKKHVTKTCKTCRFMLAWSADFSI